MNRLFFIVILGSHLLLLCGRADDNIWTGNRLTSAQPFPAAVRAVLPSWVGYHLLLEEIGGEGRLCVARVWLTAPLEYTIIADRAKEVAEEPERKKKGWTYVSPAIELDRFNWSIGPSTIGRRFGEEDILQKITKIAMPTK